MAERRMLLNKNDTFVPHLIISYNYYYSYNYDTVEIINDDNIEYKITGEGNYGIIEIMFKNEFILHYRYFIDFLYSVENIVLQNETDNLITLNKHCISIDGFIGACDTYGKFEFKNYCINSERIANINIYGSNCIFENYAFDKDVSGLCYYTNITSITIIVKHLIVWAHPHILYDLMKYNNVEEGDEKAKNYRILDNNKLMISSPTEYVTTIPSVDLGNNTYIRSVNNYMYNGNYITEYVCNNPITHLRKGITLPQNATVYFPDTVTDIDSDTFANESNLKKAVIFGNCQLTYLDGFKGSNIESIEIYSDKIEIVKEDCFYNCENLYNITIPKSVKYIEHYAFDGVGDDFNFVINYKGTKQDWSDIYLGDAWYGVTYDIIVNCIDGSFAVNPYELCKIYYTSTDGNIIDVDTLSVNNELLSNTYGDKGELVFKNAIDNITRLFRDKTQLTEVWLPNYKINNTVNAFYNCTNLTQVNNSVQLKHIEEHTFTDCESLQQIKIDSDFILDDAFSNCTFLNYVKISKRLEKIYDYAFVNCTNLESIDYEGTIEEWNNIEIESDWRDGSAIKTIHCTDGDIQL